MKKFLIALLLCACALGTDKRIKIAVLDTGRPTGFDLLPYLCEDGHTDFTGEGIDDKHGHGTNVTWLITRGLDPKKFCVVSLRYYSNGAVAFNNLHNEIRAVKKAIQLKVKYLNLSGGGEEPSENEYKVFAEALDAGIHITVAAGNNGYDLSNKQTQYYPACYYYRFLPLIRDNFWVVANGKDTTHFLPSSNRNGPVRAVKDGFRQGPEDYKMSGTSQSSAMFLNELIKRENP